jgi:hypothetical protein
VGQQGTKKVLSESARKEIFQAIVDAQDRKTSVVESRKQVAEQFGVSDTQIRQIEREGLDGEWPPL